MASSGLRINECLQLRVGDVSNNGIAAASIYAARQTTKGKIQGRRIPIGRYCRETLQDWLEYSGVGEQPASAWLWPICVGGRGVRVQYIYDKHVTYEAVVRALRITIRAAGLEGKVLTHSFRKLFAARVHSLPWGGAAPTVTISAARPLAACRC